MLVRNYSTGSFLATLCEPFFLNHDGKIETAYLATTKFFVHQTAEIKNRNVTITEKTKMYSFSFNTHGYRPTFRNFKTCVTKTLPTKMVRELDTPLRSCKVHSNRGHLGSTLHICLSKAFSYYSQKKKTGRTFFTKS